MTTASAESGNENICPQCGAENHPEAVFCGECGYPMPKRNPAQNPPAQNHPAQNHPAQNPPAQNHPAQNHPAQDRPAQDRPAQNPIGSSAQKNTNMGETDLSRINAMSFGSGSAFFDEAASNSQTSAEQPFSGKTSEPKANSAYTNSYQSSSGGYASAANVYSSDRQTAADSRTYTNARDIDRGRPPMEGRNNFVDSDEKVIVTLGSGFVQNIVSSGSPDSVSAVLTDKRLYCSGKFVTFNGKKSQYLKTSKIIEAEDITGTGFIYKSNIAFLIIAIVILTAGLLLGLIFYDDDLLLVFPIIGIVAAIAPFLIYMLKRETFFNIEYAGGTISFSIKWLNTEACKNFQRQIHLIKNKRREERAENNG